MVYRCGGQAAARRGVRLCFPVQSALLVRAWPVRTAAAATANVAGRAGGATDRGCAAPAGEAAEHAAFTGGRPLMLVRAALRWFPDRFVLVRRATSVLRTACRTPGVTGTAPRSDRVFTDGMPSAARHGRRRHAVPRRRCSSRPRMQRPGEAPDRRPAACRSARRRRR